MAVINDQYESLMFTVVFNWSRTLWPDSRLDLNAFTLPSNTEHFLFIFFPFLFFSIQILIYGDSFFLFVWLARWVIVTDSVDRFSPEVKRRASTWKKCLASKEPIERDGNLNSFDGLVRRRNVKMLNRLKLFDLCSSDLLIVTRKNQSSRSMESVTKVDRFSKAWCWIDNFLFPSGLWPKYWTEIAELRERETGATSLFRKTFITVLRLIFVSFSSSILFISLDST